MNLHRLRSALAAAIGLVICTSLGLGAPQPPASQQAPPAQQALAQQPPATSLPTPKKVGILIFPGVQVIDFTGPYEVLCHGSSKGRRLFDVVTVGLGSEMIRTGTGEPGLKITPEFSIDDAPKLDILVIPGGEIGSVSGNAKAMAWISGVVRDAECVMSVCNGAFILAEGGHLKNQKVTTFYWFLDELKAAEPTCTIVHHARFTDNGKIVTTAGLSSGIDGALHLIERYGSRFDAEQAALGLEYDWQPERNWARAGLADRHLVTMLGAAGFDFPEGSVSQWTVVENNGTLDAWTKRWTFQSALELAALMGVFESKLAAVWTRSPSNAPMGGSLWTFKDDKGRAWSARLELASTASNTWTAQIRVERTAQ